MKNDNNNFILKFMWYAKAEMIDEWFLIDMDNKVIWVIFYIIICCCIFIISVLDELFGKIIVDFK